MKPLRPCLNYGIMLPKKGRVYMSAKGPGKAFRKGMTLVEAVKVFSDEEATERLFIQTRWPNGVACPFCGSLDIRERRTRKPQPFRCGDCKGNFSVKTGTVMHGSNLSLGKWGLAMYLLSTSLKGVLSMKLHRDLGITQKAAWHLAHRIRKAWESKQGLFSGPVEVDETYVGGKVTGQGSGPKGKAIVAGVKDRATKAVAAQVVPDSKSKTLQGIVAKHTQPGAQVYTDGHKAYVGLPFPHAAVKHHVGEYVAGEASTNGIEALWSMFKRGYHGTYHHMSPQHLDRYVTEFVGRHNARQADTMEQVQSLIAGTDGKRLRYVDLVATKG